MLDAPATQHPVPRRLTAAAAAELRLDDQADDVSVLADYPLRVTLTYPAAVRFSPDRSAPLTLQVKNMTAETRSVGLVVRAPAGWMLSGEIASAAEKLGSNESKTLTFTASASEHRWRPVTSRLSITCEIDGLPLVFDAGLLMTIPWAQWSIDGLSSADEPAVSDDARLIEAPTHFIDLQPLTSDGETLVFQTVVKAPMNKGLPFPVRLVIQSPSETRLWVNGDLVLHHDGSYQVPAIHRPGPTGVDLELPGGANRLTIAVFGSSAGMLFHAIGDGPTWGWRRFVEYANPLRLKANA